MESDRIGVSYEVLPLQAEPKPLHAVLAFPAPAARPRLFYRLGKRLFDVVMSALGLVALSPVLLAVAAAVRLDSPGFPVYRHWRVGRNGRDIGLIKFRTMVADAGNLQKYLSREQIKEFYVNYKLDNDPRITRVGKFLRRTSIDELPQLLNILLGHMSFVGPRPVVKHELEEHYGALAHRFLSVPPGLTGYWQANGRSSTTYDERVMMEMYYIDNHSFWLDTKILLKTVLAVLFGHGAC